MGSVTLQDAPSLLSKHFIIFQCETVKAGCCEVLILKVACVCACVCVCASARARVCVCH